MFCSFTSYQDNVTPLNMASQNGRHDIVQTLLGAGADMNITRSGVSHVMFYYYILGVTCKLLHVRLHTNHTTKNHSSTCTCM